MAYEEAEFPRNPETRVVFLPPITEIEMPFMERMVPFVDAERVRTNLALFDGIDVSELSEDDAEYHRLIAPELHDAHETYGYMLKDLAQAPRVAETLVNVFPRNSVSFFGDSLPVNTRGITKVAEEALDGETGDPVFISSSHAALYPELLAGRSMDGGSRIGVVVFDRHADMYESDVFTLARETLGADFRLGKENVVRLILEDNIAQAVSVFGISRDEGQRIIHGYPGQSVWAPTHDVYKALETKLFLCHDGMYVNDDGGLQSYRLNQKIREALAAFRKNGIERIVFSIDADVFDFPTTAVEYTSLSLLVSLGIQDLHQAEAEAIAFAKERGYSPNKSKLKNATNLLMIRSVCQPRYIVAEAQALYSGLPKTTSGYGLSVATIQHIMDAFAQAFPVGIQLPHGGRYIGGVTELSGYDYRGQTAKAVSDLVASMSLLSHH